MLRILQRSRLMAQMLLAAAVSVLAVVSPPAAPPTGLMAEYQGGLALGAPAAPMLSWIVPPCGMPPSGGGGGGSSSHHAGAGTASVQAAYRVVVAEEKFTGGGPQHATVWDSGRVTSNASVNVLYGGAALAPASVYRWNVTTWTVSALLPVGKPMSDAATITVACQSAPSEPARFVTALHRGWPTGATWAWTAAPAPVPAPPNRATNVERFVYMRRLLDLENGGTCSAGGNRTSTAGASSAPADHGAAAPLRALLYASATIDPVILSAFKVYLGGRLVAIGPGRGEAPVRGGNGKISRYPYVTHDVTAELSQALGGGSSTVLAVEGQSPIDDHGRPDRKWDSYDPYASEHPAPKHAAVLLTLIITRADASVCTVSTGDSGGWVGRAMDDYYRPFKNHATWYHNPIENIDSRLEPVGWRTQRNFSADGWAAPVEVPIGFSDLLPKMSRPVQTTAVPPRPMVPVPSRHVAASDEPPVATCGKVVLGSTGSAGGSDRVVLRCSAGEVIDNVSFVAYGSPTGSCGSGFTADPTCDAVGALTLTESLCLGKPRCDIIAGSAGYAECLDDAGLLKPPTNSSCKKHSRTFAVQVNCGKREQYSVDFGQEFQGGVVLSLTGTSGHRVKIKAGELMGAGNDRYQKQTNRTAYSDWYDPYDYVGQTWGYEWTWTLRDGRQTIAEHNYQSFRYLELTFLDGPAPRDVSVGAWAVAYEWDPGQSAFHSSNATLDRVWRLCENTLRYVVMDTYTDSNTRERRPYESDGMIAAVNRGLLQRDRMWQRHSASWMLEYPTWPTEWQQQTPMLALSDYMATGSADLAKAYSDRLLNDTKHAFIDSTGVVGPMPHKVGQPGGHIIGWDPAPGSCDPQPNCVPASPFEASDHETPCNAWAVHGLEILAEMAGLYGDRDRAEQLGKMAGTLRSNVMRKMWNATRGHFCDGLCADRNASNSSVYTDYTTMFLGLVPQPARRAVWQSIAAHGLERIGAYGAFLYLGALAKYPEVGDDGSAILTALTKCDSTSWCGEWEQFNATTTMESFAVDVVGGTSFSHLWGASAISGIVHGLIGIRATAPGYQTFTVRPRLGGLQHASVRVPTLYGYINVTATPTSVSLNVPCNTVARACLLAPPRGDRLALALDGETVPVTREGLHLCSEVPIVCGAFGRDRVLTVDNSNKTSASLAANMKSDDAVKSNDATTPPHRMSKGRVTRVSKPDQVHHQIDMILIAFN